MQVQLVSYILFAKSGNPIPSLKLQNRITANNMPGLLQNPDI